MEVIHDLTKDGKLKIYQDTEMNSYTFDSVLLANFVTVNKKIEKVVDLCAGNAPIAMLLTRRKPNGPLNIKAVELQEEVANLGQKSIEHNQLDNVEMINDNLIGISKKIGMNKYNLITVNPPYFRLDETTNIKGNKSVAIARHELEVNLEQIIEESRKLLDNNGLLSFVFRPERLDELIVLLDKHKFKLKRLQLVYPRVGEECNTILVEAKKGQNKGQVRIEEPFYVYGPGTEYSEQTLEILKI